MKEKQANIVIAILVLACIAFAFIAAEKSTELKQANLTIATWQNSGENWMHYSQWRYSVTHTNGN